MILELTAIYLFGARENPLGLHTSDHFLLECCLAYPLKTLFEGCSKMSFDVLAGEARISKQKLEKCKLSLCCC